MKELLKTGINQLRAAEAATDPDVRESELNKFSTTAALVAVTCLDSDVQLAKNFLYALMCAERHEVIL